MKRVVILLALISVFSSTTSEAQKGRQRIVRNLNMHYLSIDKSPEGLELYKKDAMKFHRRAKRAGLERVQATITLRSAASIDQALEIVEKYKLAPRFIYAFSDKNGQVSTFGYAFSSAQRERATLMVRRDALDRNFMGIVSIITVAPVAQLEALQNDPRIFLVDLVADENFTYNQGNGQYMHHLAWDLYENEKKAR